MFGSSMVEKELSCLLGWLRTFPLQAQTSTAAELSDGLAMSEALVQIEPATFTPTWFAGVLKSSQASHENLSVLLNMLLHYYRQNLSEDCVTEENLPIPEIPGEGETLDPEDVAKFLKLILGVAVTCNNKLLFINKIQSLDETTQHALTSCIVSFISTKDWTEKQGSSNSSGVSPSVSMSESKLSPSGDEVWAQKCHELDYQVALLREERSNLMNENEELCGKVKNAQTLSRRDSLRSKHLETELAHVKDEFERLKLEYDNTRQHVNILDQKLKNGSKEQEEISRLSEEMNLLKSDLSKLQSSQGNRDSSTKWDSLKHRLESHQEVISELKNELQYQVTLQARLNSELDTVKDQVDVLREQAFSSARYSQDMGDIRSRLMMLEQIRDQDMLSGQVMMVTRDMMDTRNMSVISSDSRDSVDNIFISNLTNVTNVSQTNNQMDETFVKPTQVMPDDSVSNQEILKTYEPIVQQEILVTKSNEPDTIQAPLVIQPDENEDKSDLNIEEESHVSESEPTTEVLTNRSSNISDEDKVSERYEKQLQNEGQLKDVDEWNFSSVATIIDEKSVSDDHLHDMKDNMFKLKNGEGRKHKQDNFPLEEETPTNCFNSFMLQFFVKVFD